MAKTAAQLDRDIKAALFERSYKRIQQKSGHNLAVLIAALKKSPAIIITDRYGRRDLIVRSGEMQNRGEGKLRATMFGTDGPRGHITRNTDRELAQELAQSYAIKSVKPATDADVMRWTDTTEFSTGSKRVAFIQAVNTLSYRAGKQDKHERSREIEREAHKLIASDIDAAIAIVEAGIREIG